jgi:hypothetical protein
MFIIVCFSSIKLILLLLFLHRTSGVKDYSYYLTWLQLEEEVKTHLQNSYGEEYSLKINLYAIF